MRRKDRESVYVLRSNDLNPDPRVDKYVRYFEKKNILYKLVGWNRSAALVHKAHTDYFYRPANYGGGVKNVWGMICWNIFLFKYLYMRRRSIKIIHACDFDTVIPALLIKLFANVVVIFDVFDWYTDSRNIDNRIIKRMLCLLEKVAVKKSNYIIICEPERMVQLGRVAQDKVLIMPNIPDFPVSTFDEKLFVKYPCLSIGYVGILSRDRGLEVLLKVVAEMPMITLHIAGFGELESMVLEYSHNYSNVYFEGKVTYDKGLAILASTDCIYAMYYTNVKNHILAAPNKFYESLFLSKPLITTKGTLVGNKVKKYNSGFVIAEGEEALRNLLLNITPDMCLVKGENAQASWKNIFCNKIMDFFNNKYGPIIDNCIKQEML